MKVLIAGGGRQGYAIAYILKKKKIPFSVVDPDEERVSLLKGKKIPAICGDVFSLSREHFNGVNLLISALPAGIGEKIYHLCLEKRLDLVDVSYTEFDPFTVEKEVKESGIRVIFDAGIAPGISNLLAGKLIAELQNVEYLKILVGGIPVENVPPLGYTITWSPDDQIEEYTRPARIRKGGKEVKVPALSGVERIHREDIGELEAFYTDGLRSLLKTFPEIPDMEEKTIRYPGHAKKMKFLLDMGFFDPEPCGSTGVSPRKINLCVLKKVLNKPVDDLLVLKVIARGKDTVLTAEVFDRARNGFTAMERTTGFSCAAFALILLRKKLSPGLYPPETLYQFSDDILRILEEEGIKIDFSSGY